MESTLELFAELSIALLGFAGVVSALGRSRLSAEVRSFRIGALLINSVTALIFSILPILISAHGFSENVQWTVSTILLGIAQVSTIAWSTRQVRSLSNAEVPNSLRVVMFSLITLAILYEFYGVIFQVDYLAAIYIVGLAVSFIIGLVHFCILIVSIQNSTKNT